MRRAQGVISFHGKSSDHTRLLSRCPDRSLDVLLLLVLLVAGALRFYALDVPVILFEEGLVANASLHDWGYILRRSLYTDAHPPFFYFLTKTILWAGSSEFALRSLSAVSGVAAVFFLYRLGTRLFSRETALCAAALLAVHLLHVELSRVLRPHSLIILLSIICFDRLVCFLSAPSRRNLWLLAGANLLVCLWHFNGTLIIGAQIPVILGAMLLGHVPPRMALGSLAANSVSLLLNVVPLVVRLGKFPGVALGGNSMFWTIGRTGDNLGELLSLFPVPWMTLAGAALFALGMWSMWKRDTGLFALFAIAIAAPLAALIAARYGIIYSAQHIGFILPLLLLVVACGIGQILGRPERAVIPILLAGSLLLVGKNHSRIYGADAPMINHNLCQDAIAREMSVSFTPKAVAGFHPFYLEDFVGWYLKRYTGVDLPNAVTPEDGQVEFFLVKQQGYEQSDSEKAFGIEKSGFRQPLNVQIPCGFSVASFVIPRTPVLAVQTLPARMAVTADPEDFYGHVYEARDLTPYFSPLGNLLYPSRFDAPGAMTFRVENNTGKPVPGLDLTFFMAKTLPESTFEVFYSFDGEPARQGFAVREVTPHGWIPLRLGRAEPFRTVDITIRMVASSALPSFYNNTETVRFRSLEISLDNPGQSFDSDVSMAVTGLDYTESNPQGDFRWGRGPQTAMSFQSDKPREFALQLVAKSPIAGQRIEVVLNGTTIGQADFPEAGVNSRIAVPVKTQQGENTLALRYAYWNHGGHGPAGETFEADDPRTLAAYYSTLRLVDPVQAVVKPQDGQ